MLKKLIFPAAMIALAVIAIKNKNKMPLIGDKAPSFRANSTQGEINFPEAYKGKWVILFSHPADFTPICTTEFMTFQKMKDTFNSLNAELIGLSEDSIEHHREWLKNIKEKVTYAGMENVDITFPLMEDPKYKIAKKYGMLHPNTSTTKTVRAVFIIDPESIIRAIIYYPQSSGRNIDEIKRLLVSLQTTDKFSVVTPANWQPGEDAILQPPLTKKEALEKMEDVANLKCSEWYLCFKNLPKDQLEEKLYN